MKKLHGAAAKAHAKKVAKAKRRSNPRKPKHAPKRRRTATQIVVHAANPGRRRRKSRSMVVASNPRRLRRRRNGNGAAMSAGGSVTSLKTWEKAARIGVEAIAGGVAGGAIGAFTESRLGATPGMIGWAEVGLAALSIIAGTKAGYPAVGIGAGAVLGAQGARTIYAAHTTPPAPAAGATAPAATAGATGDGSAPAMAALTMGALTDMNGFEGQLDAVQNIDDGGNATYETDDGEEDDLDEEDDGGDESRIPSDW